MEILYNMWGYKWEIERVGGGKSEEQWNEKDTVSGWRLNNLSFWFLRLVNFTETWCTLRWWDLRLWTWTLQVLQTVKFVSLIPKVKELKKKKKKIVGKDL